MIIDCHDKTVTIIFLISLLVECLLAFWIRKRERERERKREFASTVGQVQSESRDRRAPFTRRDSLSWRASSSTRYSQKVTFTCGDALRRRHVIVFEVTAIGTCEENVECSCTRGCHWLKTSTCTAVARLALVVFQRRKRNWSRPTLSLSLSLSLSLYNSLQFVANSCVEKS